MSMNTRHLAAMAAATVVGLAASFTTVSWLSASATPTMSQIVGVGRGRLSERLTRDYLAAVFRDEVDPALVRQWARATGLPIADSGPLPTDIVRSYLGLAGAQDIAAERQQRELAAAIRKWARARDIPVPQRGRIPGYVISAYEDNQRGQGA